jgi:hypothetical protein
MPKTPIDYSKSVIYKICCKDPNVKEIYIGSTTNFTKRKYTHKFGVKKICDKHNIKLYNFIRENGGWDNWDMVMIKQYSNCKNKLKLHKKERKYIEKYNATLNGSIPFTTIEETRQKYIINNPEKVKQSKKEYLLKNPEKRKQTLQKYRDNNIEKIRERQRKHYENNREKIRERIRNNEKYKRKYKCICGTETSVYQKKRHEKTLKHQNFINAI